MAAAHTFFMAEPTRMSGLVLWEEGSLFSSGEHSAFLLRPGGTRYALRLGFILRGSEEVLFPDSLLDDWGHELTAPALYEWVRDNGHHFPRAEIFGIRLGGRPGQCFIRELDLMAGCACFAYEADSAPLASGTRLTAILTSKVGSDRPQRVPAPLGLGGLLAMAAVSWWSVDPATTAGLDLDFLD
jgi:hypothetical protein